MNLDFDTNDPRLWTYRARVTRVVDGDTIDVVIDRGFGDYLRTRVRLLGVDTPELRPRRKPLEERQREREAAIKAKDWVEEKIGGKEIILRTYKAGKYGRWLAVIWLPLPDNAIDKLGDVIAHRAGKSINDRLLEEGLARPYPSK